MIRCKEKGFTLFELMVVVGIILVLATVSLPAMSGFFKTTKVREGAETVRGALLTAELNAIRGKVATGVFFDYPHDGMIEIWTVRSNWTGGGSLLPMTDPETGGDLGGYNLPGCWKVHKVGNKPLNLPEGIRVIGFNSNGGYADNDRPFNGDISWPSMTDTKLGRLKAHWAGYKPTGGKVHWHKYGHAYKYYAVVEEGSGEHLVIMIWLSPGARPRIMGNYIITSVEGTPITDPAQLWSLIRDRTYPFSHGEIWTGQ